MRPPEEQLAAQARKGACRPVLDHSKIRKADQGEESHKQHQAKLKATKTTHRAENLMALLPRNSPDTKYCRRNTNSPRQYVVRTREIQPLRYYGLGIQCRLVQYAEEELPWISAIGAAPIDGCFRAPLARIITHVTKYHIARASVELADLYSAPFRFLGQSPMALSLAYLSPPFPENLGLWR